MAYLRLFLVFLTLACGSATAHPGGLDKDGCHNAGDKLHCH